jgi:predicted Zn finger-like uncharacterized protein
MSLVVTCPNCGTVFTMVREQLEASDGRVRCGHCMEVFDAQAQLTQLDDLDREHRADRAQNEFSPPSQSQAQAQHSDLSFVQQAKQVQFWSSPWIRVLLALVAIFLLVLLTTQLIRTEHTRLTRLIPSATPIVQKLCDLWPCALSARRQIDGWLIENSSFQKDGNAAFRLTATLKNTSQTTLLVPQLELNLLDNSDALLVRHVIAPDTSDSTILPSGAEHVYNWLITSQSNANIRLNMKDIVGYRLVLFYP